MELANLRTLFDEARRLTGHLRYVVVGSLSILGIVKGVEIPERMLVSIDVDCYTPDDPGRVFELADALGQGSAFEAANGFYLDPISPALPTLPENWLHRLVAVDLGGGIVAQFLDPNDAAVSKYARGEPRDREWIRAGIAAGLVNCAIVAARFRETTFFDRGERERAEGALEEDRGAFGALGSAMHKFT